MTLPLETPRLILRQFTPADGDAYHAAILADPDVMRYLPGSVPRLRQAADAYIEKSLAYWQAHGFGSLAVIYKANDALIGHAGIMGFIADGEELIEVFYALAKAYWGQGLAAEVAFACLKFGFEQVKLPRIVAVYETENIPSRRVMEKIGMTYQKIVETYGTQMPMYAITREEFLRSNF
jgi:ribosomal-protein-alanine N-acetyltransferase